MSVPQIKICGLTTPEAVDAAVAARATHIGLVHYPPSPRHVTLEQAMRLRVRVPREIKVVLLLVNEEAQPTLQAIQAIKPDVVQFHGSETPEWLGILKQAGAKELWKAIGVKNAEGLEKAKRFKEAEEVYQALRKEAPDDLRVVNNLAEIAISRGRYVEARTMLRSYLDQLPARDRRRRHTEKRIRRLTDAIGDAPSPAPSAAASPAPKKK